MDEPLDNDLKKRIREVFDNYHDEHADEGWLLLRERYPEKAHRRAIAWLWWSSAAAILLLFLGILLLNRRPEKENKLVNNKPGIHHPVIKSIEPQKNNNIANNERADNDRAADSVMNSVQTQAFAENNSAAHSVHKNADSKKVPGNRNTSDRIANNITNKSSIANNEIPANNSSDQAIAAINPTKSIAKQPVGITQADNSAKIDSGANSITQSVAVAKQNNGVNMMDQAKQPGKTLFADNEVPKDKKAKSQEYSGRAFRFGIYAATYVNYAKGSNNRINEGLGISSDIRLSRKLNLSTGVAIGQNSLSYGNQLPPEQSRLLAASNPTASSNTLAAAAYNKYGYSAATPSLKNYNANLVGLEVPINLKYHFNPDKSATFVSMGVSSGTFIKETYTSTYNYVTPFASNLSQTTDQSLQQKFNSFYFAKTLNFSVGTGYRVAGNDLIIEPFVKYPIQGLGAQQIKFGSGGVNLKFSFQGGRHK